MNYVPPFEIVKEKFRIIGGNDKRRIDMRHTDFINVLKLMLRAVDVDEKWYLQKYPDVADAIKANTYKSAKHHFVEEGYFEGRWPYEFGIDEEWYKSQYTDVADGVSTGLLTSPRAHFLAHGYKEGRLPVPY